MEQDRVSALTDLYAEIARCQRCVLAHSRKLTVPGEGPADAELMFIGVRIMRPAPHAQACRPGGRPGRRRDFVYW